MFLCLKPAIAALITANFIFASTVFAEDGPPLGGPTSTKSWVPEACDPESFKGQLDQQDPKKSEHEKAVQACHDEVKKSDTACQPGSNPNAQQAQNQANQYQQNTNQSAQQTSGSGSGQSNNCGGFGDLMKNMQPPLQQYQGDCNGAKSVCQSTCSKKAEESKKACDSIIVKDQKTKMQKQACERNAAGVKACTKKTAAACEKYSQQVAAIAAALMNGLMQMMQMQKCQEDQGLDCTKDPTNPQCLKDDSVNCSKPEHYANPQCICQVNPNAGGCPGADSAKAAQMPGRDPYSNDNGATDGTPTTSPTTDAGLDGNRRKNAGAGAGGSGSGFGGGSGGSGGARGAEAAAAGAGQKPANPDILAGDYGGGGGGRGGMGGGYPEVTDSGMGRALKNADLRKTASAGGALTGANGRSNWQKVRERYRDNRSSLMEQGK